MLTNFTFVGYLLTQLPSFWRHFLAFDLILGTCSPIWRHFGDIFTLHVEAMMRSTSLSNVSHVDRVEDEDRYDGYHVWRICGGKKK